MTNGYFNSKPDSIFEAATKVLSEGKYVVSTDNLKKVFKALSTAQNGLDVAIKDYDSIEGPSGHGSGHYQAAMVVEYYRKKVKEHISAMIEIQEGLMESGEMTKLLQRAFIDELEDNVKSLQKQIESRDDNNYVLNSQLRERKAILAKAKEDLKTLKESSCDDEESNINEASGQSDPDITVWTKKGKHNFNSFLAANEDRIGKPMIDGGLKANYKDADQVNGQPVEGVIYCGAGCVTFKDRDGEKVFIKLPSKYLNDADGTLPWSEWRDYDSEGVYVSIGEAQFNAVAKALTIAAKV
jgi:hypothetical protein